MAANMANMPQMGGGGPVRQRPPHQQLSQLVYTQMMTQVSQTNGWQDQVQANLRVSNAMNLISNSFLAMPAVDSQQLISNGLQFEREAFLNSPDKVTYEQKINSRVQDLFKRRQANEQSLKNTLNNQSQAQAQAQAQMMMNHGMMSRGAGQQPQPGFQHLQQPMQASPIQQPHQPGMAGHGGFPMNPNQQSMQMGGPQMRPQMPMQTTMNSLSPADRSKVVQMAMSRLNQTPEHQRNQLRAMLQQKMTPQQLATLQSENADPLLYFFQNDILRRGHAGAAGMGHNQAAMQAAHAQAQAQAQQAQAQRQMNPSPQQLPGATNGEFGQFTGNVESIINQQKAGMLAQDAGQLVVPASNGPGRNATPQPISGIQGPNPGNHLGPNQTGMSHGLQQPFNLPQAQQLKMDQRAAQSQAQIRAQAQAKQMQGQPGGVLNGAGGMSQSPGMNTLNTPVRRPVGMGQGEGQQQMGQPNGPFGQGLDPRFNQGNQRPQMGANPQMYNPQMQSSQMMNPQTLNNALVTMPAEMRGVFMSMPPDKRNEMLLKYAGQQRQNQMAGRGQPQPGQFGPGNPMVQFSPGNNTGQQPNPGMPMNQNQALQQRLRNNMHAGNRQAIPQDQNAFMDTMDVPVRILEQMRTSQNPPPPPEVKKWAQLKQWLAQKSIPPAYHNNLMQLQMAQWQGMMKQRSAAAAANQIPQVSMQQQQQGPQPSNGPMSVQHAAGIPHFTTIPVTPQEIQSAKMHERFKNVPDERIKFTLQQMKVHSMRKASAQMAGGQMHTPQTSQPASNSMTTPGQPLSTPGGLQQRQQNTGPDANAMGAAASRNNRPPQNNRPQQNGPTTTPQQKNSLKRPSTDDVVEVPAPSPIQRAPSQQGSGSGSGPGPQAPQWNSSQLANLPADQRNKLEAFKNRQQAAAAAMGSGGAGQQPQMSEEMQRLKAIGQDEHNLAMKEPFQEIPMTGEQYQEMAQKIQSMVQEMGKLSKILGRWYTLTRDDNRARMFFKMRLRLIKQYADGDKMSILKKAFSLLPKDLEGVREMLEGMARDVASTYPQGLKRNPPTQQAASDAGPSHAADNATAPSTGQPAPLNVANLEKQTQVLNKMHQRSTSKNGQAPAAPTTSQPPPFSFGAQSPNGQPTYIGKPTVTQEDLHLPARKKVKTGAQSGLGSRGPSANSSPQVQKAPSPEMVKRPSSTEAKPPPKLQFFCLKENCDMHYVGFATQQALNAHYEEEHVIPYKDPRAFVGSCVRDALGLDDDGKAVGPPKIPYQLPASPKGSMKRQASAPGSKPGEVGKVNDGKNGTPKPGPTQPAATEIDWSRATVDPQNLFGDWLGGGGGGAIADMNVYRAISPHDTPESTGKDSSSSEPTSDLSDGVALNVTLDMGFDQWHPFEAHPYVQKDAGMGDNAPPMFDWDDVHIDFDAPFPGLDPSLYHLDVS